MDKIRLSKSTVTENDKRAVMRALDNEYLGMGAEVMALENELKAFVGTDKSAACVNTGTAALHLAVQCADLGPGDEIIIPSITYAATFQAVSAAGAVPVACDIMEDTVFIDLKDAERRLSKRAKALIPVHYAGDFQCMDAVYDFAKKHGLIVIEDAAHSFGGTKNDRASGADGDIVCFSFDGIKNITCGEGGAVLTRDAEIYRKICDARLLGVEKDTEKRYAGKRSWEFDIHYQGWRYHMSNIMAALGREQLKRIGKAGEKRRSVARRYMELLAGVKELAFLKLDWANIVNHLFVIRVLDGRRDALRECLAGHNIETGIHYYPNHLLSKFKTSYSLPVSERVHSQILSLPCHLDLTDVQIEFVSQKIREFFHA